MSQAPAAPQESVKSVLDFMHSRTEKFSDKVAMCIRAGDKWRELTYGELQARCGISWSSMKISKPGWAAGEVVNILMQLRLEKDAALPNTPLLGDWVTNPKDRAALAVLMASPELGYPVFLPPGVPAGRAQALRRGFGLVMNDPDFAAELARQQLDLSPTDGAAMQAAIAALYRTPADIVARVRDLAVAREAK